MQVSLCVSMSPCVFVSQCLCVSRIKELKQTRELERRGLTTWTFFINLLGWTLKDKETSHASVLRSLHKQGSRAELLIPDQSRPGSTWCKHTNIHSTCHVYILMYGDAFGLNMRIGFMSLTGSTIHCTMHAGILVWGQQGRSQMELRPSVLAGSAQGESFPRQPTNLSQTECFRSSRVKKHC